MNLGELTTAAYDRTVLKQYGKYCKDKPWSARREDLEIADHLRLAEEKRAGKRLYSAVSSGNESVAAYAAVCRALASCKADNLVLDLAVPEAADEKFIRSFVREAAEAAERSGYDFDEINIRRTDAGEALVTVVAGEMKAAVMNDEKAVAEEAQERIAAEAESESEEEGSVENKDLYILQAGYAAAGMSLVLRDRLKEKLEEKFPKHFLDTAELKEGLAAAAMLSGRAASTGSTIDKADSTENTRRNATLPIRYPVSVNEGGIFAALWKLGEALHLGMEVNLPDIRIHPLGIEIYEMLDINPYESGDAILFVTDEPEAALEICEKEKVAAAIIGRLKKDETRVIINGDEIRYLEPFKGDSLWESR